MMSEKDFLAMMGREIIDDFKGFEAVESKGSDPILGDYHAIRWAHPKSNNLSGTFLLANGNLVATGDFDDAIYSWGRKINAGDLADMCLSYFAEKCVTHSKTWEPGVIAFNIKKDIEGEIEHLLTTSADNYALEQLQDIDNDRIYEASSDPQTYSDFMDELGWGDEPPHLVVDTVVYRHWIAVQLACKQLREKPFRAKAEEPLSHIDISILQHFVQHEERAFSPYSVYQIICPDNVLPASPFAAREEISYININKSLHKLVDQGYIFPLATELYMHNSKCRKMGATLPDLLEESVVTDLLKATPNKWFLEREINRMLGYRFDAGRTSGIIRSLVNKGQLSEYDLFFAWAKEQA